MSSGDTSEDILADSLAFLGGKPVIEDENFTYGPLTLTIAPKEGKANTLLADHVFSPALFLAERIERGLINEAGRTVLELGSGTGLPSLLLASHPSPPSLVILTDHPNPTIFHNLCKNLRANRAHFTPGCKVSCAGYEWGDEEGMEGLLSVLPPAPPRTEEPGYDTIILSDLLHFFDSHASLVWSITELLARSRTARVHVGAGTYTPASTCAHFFTLAAQRGLAFHEVLPTSDEDKEWRGTMRVAKLDAADLKARKGACRYWVGGWA